MLGDNLTGRCKLKTAGTGTGGQGLEELQNTGAQRLENTQSNQLHKDVDHILTFRQSGNPIAIGVGGDGLRSEAQRDVVGEVVVAHQKTQTVVLGATVHIVRALPAEDVLGTLCYHTLEAHIGTNGANLVRINQRGVAHHLGGLAEELVHLLGLTLNLLTEALLIADGSQTVAVGLCKELHALCLGQLLQKVDHLGGVLLQHLDGGAGKRESHLEALVLLRHIKHGGKCGDVTVARSLLNGALVLVVIVVVMILADVEEAIPLQVDGLMYLEIQTNLFHCLIRF